MNVFVAKIQNDLFCRNLFLVLFLLFEQTNITQSAAFFTLSRNHPIWFTNGKKFTQTVNATRILTLAFNISEKRGGASALRSPTSDV